MLKIRDLHKKYGNYHALDGLSMEIRDGALFGFVGPNVPERRQRSRS